LYIIKKIVPAVGTIKLVVDRKILVFKFLKPIILDKKGVLGVEN
jgi:hypothetical protein